MDYHTPHQIPMSSPDLTDAERQAVMAVLNTSSLSIGPQLKAFETAVSQYIGSRHAVGVSSGTAGLHLCLLAAGIEPDDVVITTPFSFVASTNVILYEQAVPIFVDVDPATGNIDPQQVRKAAEDISNGGTAAWHWLPRKGNGRSDRLKAIMAVDVFGQPADMDALRQVATDFHLCLIEDSCEALGAEYKGRKAGTLGDYGVFGFYPNKQITTGEGGMIVTDDDQAASLFHSLRNQGRSSGDTWLQHTLLGYNYRLDEMSAALGVVQMTRLEELLRRRQQVADWYNGHLAEIPALELPYIAPDTTRATWFVYVVRLKPGIDRAAVAQNLAKQGIPVRPYFVPIHLQPYMVKRFGYHLGDFPVTEDLGRRGLALPFSSRMTEEQVELVCEVLKQSTEL